MQTKNFLGILALVVVVLAGGAFVLNKSNSTTSQEAAAAQAPTTPPVDATSPTPAPTTAIQYKDGTYSASGTYNAPSGTETVHVTLTLAGGVVTDSTVTADGVNPMSKRFQNMFISGYKQYVTGKNISDVNVTNVSGSSLTGQGFNAAVETIKTEAKA